MRKILSAAAVAAAMLSAPAAHAGLLIDFDEAASNVTITSNTPEFCVLGTCKLSADLLDPFPTVDLEVGQSAEFNFVTFFVSRGFGYENNARVDATLAFVSPIAAPAQTGGSANYLRLGGIFTQGVVAGDLIWDNPIQQITAANGSKFTVQFSNLRGVTFGNNATAKVKVTVDSIAAVPEPGAWALMIGGFGMAGAALRRRRALAAA
jgi:hypothetical protein